MSLNALGTQIGTDIAKVNSKVLLDAEATMTGYGNTKRVDNTKRFLETNVPNVIVDQVGDQVRFSDGLIDTLGSELVTNGDFSNGTTGWTAGVNTTLTKIDSKLYAESNSTDGAYFGQQLVGLKPNSTYKLIVYTQSHIKCFLGSSVGTGNLWNNDTLTNGKKELSITTSYNGSVFLWLYGGNSSTRVDNPIVIDNISVKELPQATLPLAPFAAGSTDELLDDKVNGVTTQTNHTKGDIVVSGNELITNGTFDTSISGWIPYVHSQIYNNGRLQMWNTTSSGGWTRQDLHLSQGASYIIKCDIEVIGANTATGIQIRRVADNSLVVQNASSNTGKYTTSLNYTFSGGYVYLAILLNPINTTRVDIYVDNISVRAVDDIHQAITDTIAGDLLTDTTKFQPIDYVTRYDVIGYTKTGYKTFKGLATFDEDMSTDGIASSQGWSKISDGIYALPDGTEITSLRTEQRLNSGGEHRAYNTLGRARLNGSTMGGIDTTATSTYDCFAGTLTGGTIASGLAGVDGKYYDAVYNEGTGGIVGNGSYAINDIDLDIESTKLLSGSDLELTNNILTSGTSLIVDDITDIAKTVWSMSRKAITVYQVLVSVDNGVTWSLTSHTHDAVNNTVTIASATQVKISYTAKNKPLHQHTPLPIEKVQPKAIGTNSHSVYKGAMVSNAVTGKVSVGNGTNGLESRVLENGELDETKTITTIPQHNAITLDNANSPASKYFTSLAVDTTNNEYVIQVTGEELAFNATTNAYDGVPTNDFKQLTNGTRTDVNGKVVKTANLIKRTGVFKK